MSHRQQVPERNQKKKKKMKWRAERSTGSHRFHCAILWHPSSPLPLIHTHTHTYIPYGWQGTPQQWSSTGAQKGRGANAWLDGSRVMKEEWIWNTGLGMSAMPFLLNLWSFQTFVFDPYHVPSSQNYSVIKQFHGTASFSSLWGNQRISESTRSWNFLLLE